jgi:ornithine cyclodeaminase/alanine dehydrogenase-like protein (mu-crystallin family)
VLTDDNVKDLLHTLNKQDVTLLSENLAEALHSYSTGDTNSGCCSSFQPQRTVIKKNGVTTLFMPASTNGSVGMKIVSLETPEAPSKKGSVSSQSGQSSDKSISSSMSGLTLTPASTMSSADSVSGKSFAPPASIASAASTAPKGTVTMLDQQGNPVGILNAEELTAFRTALAATMMMKKRQNVHTVTVFGAGKQAYWHIRLSLLLRGDEIRHVNIINRSFERSIKLMKSFQIPDDVEPQWKRDVKFSALSPEFGEYGRLLKDEVRKADVIFCCTPSLDPLFPPEFLTSREGQRKGRYVSAIGSYAPHMTELHPDIFRQAVAHEHGHHHHKHAKTGGVVIVDTLEGCLKEAGEIIQAKLKPEHLVEIGELIMIKKSVHKEIELGGEGEKGLIEWLTKGNVVYKSVGLGLMDLTVGGDLIRLAKERNVGTTIPDF